MNERRREYTVGISTEAPDTDHEGSMELGNLYILHHNFINLGLNKKC